MAPKNFFAIIKGGVDQPTIFNSQWDQIKPLVTRVKNTNFKGFMTLDDAEAWMRDQKVDNYVVDGATPQEPDVDWDSRSVETNMPLPDVQSTSEPDKTPPASISGDDVQSHSDGVGGNHRRQQTRRAPAQLRLTVDISDPDKLADVLRSVKI